MAQAQEITETTERRRTLEHMLCGYRFRVCETPSDIARALDVRRRVYENDLGSRFPIPDNYDHRSVLLLAERATTGEAIGTIRLTPRSGGPLEVEEHFDLPSEYRASDTVEITRFAILPEYRGTNVMAGLLKLMAFCLREMDARWVVAGALDGRIQTYAWLTMLNTGVTATYEGLNGKVVTLMAANFPEVARTMPESHPLRQFWLEVESPEVQFGSRVRTMLRGWTSVRLAG